MRIGDSVKVLRSPWGLVGRVGVITEVTRDGFLKVEIDGDSWFFWPHDVELARLTA